MSTSTDSIEQREQEIVEEFSFFDDWMGKYEYLIEQGKNLPLINERYKTEEYKVHGCQSQVWVHAEAHNGLVNYTADSDAHITRGLIALLIRVLSGQPAEAIAGAKLGFLDQIGLQEHLSPTRKNGLAGMIKRMKLYALIQHQIANVEDR
jgi:cysteine desulfuration protein SufE